MVNRLLIRIKIVQLLYAHVQSHTTLYNSREELMRSMESAYKLYNYLLALVVKVTDYRRDQLETARKKYMPTEEERCPNTRFVDNKTAEILRLRSGVMNYCEEAGLLSDFDTELYRNLLDQLMQTPTYLAFMESTDTSLAAEKAMWRSFFAEVIPNCDELDRTLEGKDLYWNDDLSIVTCFAEKTVQRLRETDEQVETLPMFRHEEDRNFAVDLYEAALQHATEFLQLIDSVSANWEVNRIAYMDRIVMVCALAEILTFPDIPVKITLNEYIELSKHYSTPSSARFVNGILDRIVQNWRAEGKIVKA
jgi:N utilization substance protein B